MEEEKKLTKYIQRKDESELKSFIYTVGFDCHHHHLSINALLKVLLKGLEEELDECHHEGCKVSIPW